MACLLRNKLFCHPNIYDLYGRVLMSCAYNLNIIIHSLSTIYTSRINFYYRNWWNNSWDIVKYVTRKMCRFHVVLGKKISILNYITCYIYNKVSKLHTVAIMITGYLNDKTKNSTEKYFQCKKCMCIQWNLYQYLYNCGYHRQEMRW